MLYHSFKTVCTTPFAAVAMLLIALGFYGIFANIEGRPFPAEIIGSTGIIVCGVCIYSLVSMNLCGCGYLGNLCSALSICLFGISGAVEGSYWTIKAQIDHQWMSRINIDWKPAMGSWDMSHNAHYTMIGLAVVAFILMIIAGAIRNGVVAKRRVAELEALNAELRRQQKPAIVAPIPIS